MKLRILVVGRGGVSWSEAATADYGKRLGRYAKLEEKRLRKARFRGDVEAVRAAEGEAILGEVGPRDYLVALDERGEALDTDGFTELLEHCRTRGVHRLCFAIGGPYGHSPAVRDAAWRVVRLSSLVLNHELARVVLYEQLYRGLTRIHGAPYHH